MIEKRVYRDYIQAELDQNYDQSTLVKNLSDYVERWRKEVERAKATLACRLGVSYGHNLDQVMDIYGVSEGASKPIILNLHGGAWRRMSAATSASPAPAFVRVGALFAVPDFSLAPDVPLDEMVRQCREALQYLLANARQYGGDPTRLYVLGHSSGGHLAAMVAQQETSVKAIATCSGIYDLEPVRLSARNEYLFLDQEAAHRNSPISHISGTTPPALVAWGGHELPEFQRQAKMFVEALEAQALKVTALQVPEQNHFDILDHLADENSALFQEIMKWFDLK